MKKIVSTQGLLFGEFDDNNISCAINERVNPKLEMFYKQFPNNDYIHIESKLSYTLFDGQVTSLLLVNTIDNPTTQRLEYFRDTCEGFYDVFGFMVDNDSSIPSVFLKATDIYDMASLIHALDYHGVCLESVMCAIDADLTEKDAIFTLLQAHICCNYPIYPVTESRKAPFSSVLVLPDIASVSENSMSPKILSVRMRRSAIILTI